MVRVVHYVAENGTDYFDEWLQNQDSKKLVILLVGGTKKRQAGDIEMAQACWKVYQQEKQ